MFFTDLDSLTNVIKVYKLLKDKSEEKHWDDNQVEKIENYLRDNENSTRFPMHLCITQKALILAVVSKESLIRFKHNTLINNRDSLRSWKKDGDLTNITAHMFIFKKKGWYFLTTLFLWRAIENCSFLVISFVISTSSSISSCNNSSITSSRVMMPTMVLRKDNINRDA